MGDKGNVLFLILIAVALFAGLSFSITQTSRTSGNIEREKAIVGAGELMQYVSSIGDAVSRAQVTSECGLNEIDFAATNMAANTNADQGCAIFSTPGFGLYDTDWKEQIIDANSPCAETSQSGPCNAFPHIGFAKMSNIGTTLPDLLVLIRGVQRRVCIELNRKLGIGTEGAEPPTELFDAAFMTYEGNMSVLPDAGATVADLTNDNPSILSGMQSFCFRSEFSGAFNGYFFVYLLETR